MLREKYDVIINATPIGSGYLAGQTLVSDEMIKSSSLIVEMVSNPIDTALIKKARIEEISTICGDEVAFFTTYLADCILTEKEPLTEEALHVYSEFLKTRNGDVK